MSSTPRDVLQFRREGIDAALRRAAIEARRLADQTNTPFFVIRQGQVVDLRSETTPKAR